MRFVCINTLLLCYWLAISHVSANDHNPLLNFRLSEVQLDFNNNGKEYTDNNDSSFTVKTSQKKKKAKKPRELRRTAFAVHAGYSPYHGFLGMEFQWQYFSLNVGATDHLNGGARYYIRRGLVDSFYVGGFATFIDKYGVVGSGIGYRWIKESGFTINLGIGFGIFFEKDSNSDVSTPMLTPSLTVGWTF